MPRIASMTLALLLLLGCTRTAFAQADTVGLGARVRVTIVPGGPLPGGAPTTHVIEGVLVEVTDRAIAIRVDRAVDPVSVDKDVANTHRATVFRKLTEKRW